MKCNWEDLPKPKSCFTVCNTAMINLNTKKVVQHYSTNTKIVVVQKCITEEGTYYRTATAAYHYLNYAFKASALGLPNEFAPPEPLPKINSLDRNTSKSRSPAKHTQRPVKKQKSSQTVASPKGGVGERRKSWFSRLFRRNNG